MGTIKLVLTPVKPVGFQASFFDPAPMPTYPPDAVRLGDELKSFRMERTIGATRAAELLGITVDELSGCECGAYRFDMDLGKKLLRGGK